mmetsp:Transcript_99708/g.302729  ORF Transcript_99708/g.302729 Transcript_99708/m.302729 type:complete len:409 (-) Transcript_99708:56-1282(-)
MRKGLMQPSLMPPLQEAPHRVFADCAVLVGAQLEECLLEDLQVLQLHELSVLEAEFQEAVGVGLLRELLGQLGVSLVGLHGVELLAELQREHQLREGADDRHERGGAEEHPEGPEDLAPLRQRREGAEAHGAQRDDGHVDALPHCAALPGVVDEEGAADDAEDGVDGTAVQEPLPRQRGHARLDPLLGGRLLALGLRQALRGRRLRSLLPLRLQVLELVGEVFRVGRDQGHDLSKDVRNDDEREDHVEGNEDLGPLPCWGDVAVAHRCEDLRHQVDALDHGKGSEACPMGRLEEQHLGEEEDAGEEDEPHDHEHQDLRLRYVAAFQLDDDQGQAGDHRRPRECDEALHGEGKARLVDPNDRCLGVVVIRDRARHPNVFGAINAQGEARGGEEQAAPGRLHWQLQVAEL